MCPLSSARWAEGICIVYHIPLTLLPLIPVDFGQAEAQFKKIWAIDPFRIDDIDIYSNILYVAENKVALSKLAHEFLALDKDRPEICCLVGEEHPDFHSCRAKQVAQWARFFRQSLLTARGTRESDQVLQTRYSIGSDVLVSVDVDGP